MTFKQVYSHNDWEYIYYNFKNGGMSRASEADPILVAGKKINVKFKDGTIESHTIVAKPYTTSYNDMGHTYTASGERLGIIVKVRGSKMFMELDKLKVEV